ncbi:MAG: segregation/condensation protein A [Candidatus Pacebacteria bacterium]|nr:segregation/condensation protein A [Candidatus Paceibacterota bacterium]MCD8507944.1 segregation/condensation protein A [Candidatus Paceibacterota bacterium]MCD8528155.1 segregation/condensation protein A [Candidatus Paceibacterota bacterium]MCD8563649.1 segregation/condensation protein A [Candidatus Paceibacterota bacterium]
MESTIYHVQSAVFEGPIELLLRLIEQRKLPINDISLALVADDYVRMTQSQGMISLHQSTQFLVVASTLVLIKSRSLLPTLELTEEEEESIHDLERRVRMYKIFQTKVPFIEERWGKARLYMRPTPPVEIVFTPDPAISADMLYALVRDIVKEVPVPEKLETAHVATVVRIEDMMQRLEREIQRGSQFTFSSLLTKRSSPPRTKEEARAIKVEVVVGFLALLEMVRNGLLSVAQEHTFQDIIIHERK